MSSDSPAGRQGSGSAKDRSGGPRVRAFGDRGYLVEPPAPQRQPGPQATRWVLGVADAARARWPAATVVAGLASVLVVFDTPADRPSALAGPPERWLPEPGERPGATADGQRVHRVPTRYDGPDLGGVARALDIPVGELVSRHGRAEWTVAALGFSPGFGYLTCPDPLFSSVPRRADPRPRVPAGSVALAAGMCAVYPSATPGGWQLVGSTDRVLFDPGQDPPAVLAAGDRIVFDELP